MISVDTGEVLDYDIESKVCMERTRKREMYGEESDELKGTKTNELEAILVLVVLWNALLSKRSGLVPLIIN